MGKRGTLLAISLPFHLAVQLDSYWERRLVVCRQLCPWLPFECGRLGLCLAWMETFVKEGFTGVWAGNVLFI